MNKIVLYIIGIPVPCDRFSNRLQAADTCGYKINFFDISDLRLFA